jgi:hypothetical protein
MRRHSVHVPTPILVGVLAGSLAAQQRTLVVDASSGPFFDLPAAVLASQPGDRIEVHAAAVPYRLTQISHGLDVDASPGAVVGGLEINNLPPEQAVRIDGLTVLGAITTVGTFNGLIVFFCQGPVHLHRVTTRGLGISNSNRVLISDSAITGIDGLHPTSPAALVVGASNAVATRCSVRGYDVGVPGGSGVPGQTAVLLGNANLTLIDCTVDGGIGAVPLNCGSAGQVPGPGGNAVDGTGTLVAVGATALRGGAGGACGALTAPAGAVTTGSVALIIGPSVTLNGTVASPPTAIGEPPHMAASTLLLQGTTATISVSAPPQAIALLGLDIWHDVQPLPGNDLPILLPLATALLAGIATADASGTARFFLPIPAAPWIANQFAMLQAAVFDASGTLRLSTPGLARIR